MSKNRSMDDQKAEIRRFTDLASIYGWQVKKHDDGQLMGSAADLFAQMAGEFGGIDMMLIDDGNVGTGPFGRVFHIYHATDDQMESPGHDLLDGKIFEGRIPTPAHFHLLMECLGFTLKFN